MEQKIILGIVMAICLTGGFSWGQFHERRSTERRRMADNAAIMDALRRSPAFVATEVVTKDIVFKDNVYYDVASKPEHITTPSER